MYLVLLETSGNQNYIFSTNKLRENIGASELTYCVGTKWLLEIVSEINGTPELKNFSTSGQLREKLTNPQLNPPIESSNKPVEIVIATSGKALLLTKDDAIAKNIITKLTTKALKEAPGIDLCGVYVEFEWQETNLENPRSLVKAIKKVYKKFKEVHDKKPSPQLRFLRLPIVDECSTSGFPAACLTSDKQNISQTNYEKRSQADSAIDRIKTIINDSGQNLRLTSRIGELTENNFEGLKWLAVVHADGNGLGQIFLKFEKYIIDDDNQQVENFYREYVNKLRKFSLALDICTEKAFLSSISAFEANRKNALPIVPIILGGDDLTVVCDGKAALEFTHKFLQEFERETAIEDPEHQDGVIPKIAEKAFKGVKRLSACAGVAIIKPHFPFSVAYELAEDLIKQAKNVKTKVKTEKDESPYPCSALDFHILYDSSGVDLEQIRKKLIVDQGQTKLYLRPYVITTIQELGDATGKEWAEFHHWDNFQQKLDCLKLTDKNDQNNSAINQDSDNKISSTQINSLYSALFQGREVADSQYRLIKQRYQRLSEFEGEENSLFALEPTSENVMITSLLDALEAVEFKK